MKQISVLKTVSTVDSCKFTAEQEPSGYNSHIDSAELGMDHVDCDRERYQSKMC